VARAPWLPQAPLHAYTLPPENLDVPIAAAADGPEPIPITREKRHDPTEPPRAPSARLRDRGLTRTVEGLAMPSTSSASTGDASPPSVKLATGGYFSSLDYIGQAGRTYLVCEAPDELVIVDQHAAHERITFERLRQMHRQKHVVSQRLLFPIPVELDDEVMAAVREKNLLSDLEGLGFEVEDFGPKTLLLRAVPDLLKKADPKPLLLDVITGLGEDSRIDAAGERFDEVFATMACHGALRAGDEIAREQALALLKQLDEVDLRSHCPHGRPVLFALPMKEIGQRLGRS
jgi:DNA mismatch repair protein MutL